MRDKHKTLLVISGLAAAVLGVFWSVHKFEFVNYDDNKYVTENRHISSGFTSKNVIWVFTHEHCDNWHPLTGLSHILDCEFFGLNAGRHHLINLLLHIINTVLVFIIFRMLTGAFWQSAFVAAVFGLHPLHVESVAWISERKDVLSAMFWFLTMAAYFHYVKNPKLNRYILALGLFAMGLMSKPMLVTLPFALLLLDYWPLERLTLVKMNSAGDIWKNIRHLVWEKMPFFILSVVSCVITVVVQSKTGALKDIEQLRFSVRVFNAVVSYVRYVLKMVWPTDLAVFYPHPGGTLPRWQIAGAIVLLAAVTFLVVRAGGQYKYLFTGWFWFLGTLVPVIGLVQVGGQSIADRYTYIPLVGLFIIIAWGTNDLLAGWRHKELVLWLLSSAVIFILAVLTTFQVGYWRDSISLFEHAIKVTSRNYLAYGNRGFAYYNKGEYAKALSDFNKAIEFNPRDFLAYNNRGMTYAQVKGDYAKAISDFNKALDINPRYAEAYNNRGNTYAIGKGEYDHAISDYNKAIEFNPNYVDAYNNRGNIYAQGKGEYIKAIPDYAKAIEINPTGAQTYFNMAIAYEKVGRKKEAIEAYKAFIRYAPAASAQDVDLARQKIMELER